MYRRVTGSRSVRHAVVSMRFVPVAFDCRARKEQKRCRGSAGATPRVKPALRRVREGSCRRRDDLTEFPPSGTPPPRKHARQTCLISLPWTVECRHRAPRESEWSARPPSPVCISVPSRISTSRAIRVPSMPHDRPARAPSHHTPGIAAARSGPRAPSASIHPPPEPLTRGWRRMPTSDRGGHRSRAPL